MCEAASQNIHDLHKVVRASTEATTIRNTLAAISPIFCSVGRTKIDRSAEIHTHTYQHELLWFFFLLNVKVRNVPFRSIWECMLFLKLHIFLIHFFLIPMLASLHYKKIFLFFGGKCFYPNLDRFIFVALQINGYWVNIIDIFIDFNVKTKA